MCVNGEDMLLIDRFIIDMGMLSYPTNFSAGNLKDLTEGNHQRKDFYAKWQIELIRLARFGPIVLK